MQITYGTYELYVKTFAHSFFKLFFYVFVVIVF